MRNLSLFAVKFLMDAWVRDVSRDVIVPENMGVRVKHRKTKEIDIFFNLKKLKKKLQKNSIIFDQSESWICENTSSPTGAPSSVLLTSA